LLTALLLGLLVTAPAEATRVKDVGHFLGVQPQSLEGTGLVVGLRRTGDSPRNEAAIRALATRLQAMGMRLDVTELASRNIALVYVHAEIPADARVGQKLDVLVSAAGDAFNQNIAQIVAEELRNATNRKRRIRIKKGTLLHVKPSNYWYFPSPNRLVQLDPARAKLTYTCSPGALESTEGRRQNREN